jgi:hypothetical protein
MKKTVIFAGPSLDSRKLASMTTASIAPPIRRGDLDEFADHDQFVLIDGEFGQSLSVSPKEILTLLDRGKVVIGASSMGALRASELDVYGMIGVGWVYERFARAAVRRDDDVALAFSPLDFTPVTVPMVNVEYWLEVLQSKGKVRKQEEAAIRRAARAIFFADRTEARLFSALRKVLGADRVDSLLAETRGRISDIKAIDARRAIRLAHEM